MTQYDEHVHAGFRQVGLTRLAMASPLSGPAFEWKAKWNGVAPENAPWQCRYASNATMRDYIEQKAQTHD